LKEVTAFVDYFCKAGEKQKIHFMWRPALRDPNDDMVLELGVAAGADILTFNTRDFGAAGSYGVRVLEPGEYLRELEGVK
jgi:predicted nucleic acid-binding protein